MYGKKVRLRIVFIISVLTTIILSIYIILKLLEDDVVYFKSPTEIKQSSKNITKKIRVGGMVKKNSVTLDNEKIEFTHRAEDRSIFALGALKGAAWLTERSVGLYSMSDIYSS